MPQLIIEQDTSHNPSEILTLCVEGYTVRIGLNRESNEILIQEHQSLHPNCLWLHALAAPGSHVICCLGEKDQIPYAILQRVGKFAIEYSRSKGTTVRFARLSDLFKPDGASAGIWHAKPYRTFDI